MTTSNAEKQARFRKKESLKRYADEILREMMRFQGTFMRKSFEELRYTIDKIIELPSGWTDEDYQQAVNNLKRMVVERYDNPHLLENDVYDGLNSWNEFKTTPDPAGFTKECKKAIENTRKLAAHIVSALSLSGLGDALQAAALMEVARFIGHSLISRPKIQKSKAVAMCLAGAGPQYERPEWFAEHLAETLAWNIGKDLSRDLGRRLCEFEYGNLKI